MPKLATPVSVNCPLNVPSLYSGLLLMVQMGSKMGSIAADSIWKFSIRVLVRESGHGQRTGLEI